ncbi:MAG TPA: PepSY-associated TM helix domain-containing protein, partial [Vicinamibacterales bacterium]
SVPPGTRAERLPVEALLSRLRDDRPDVVATAITIRSEADAPVAFAVPQRVFYADAYTGAVLGEGSQTVRRLMSQLRAWHRWIAIEGEGRPLARAITGWSNVLFLFIIASGAYLWLPRKWTWSQVKAVVVFNPSARGKARDFNWHNVIGIWLAIPLFVVVISAVPISFPWGNTLVYRAVGEAPPAPAGRAAGPGGLREQRVVPVAGLNTLWTRAERHAGAPAARFGRGGVEVPGWRTISMRIPSSADASVVFTIDRGDGGQPHLRSTLTLDRDTADVVTYETFADLTVGRRIRNVMRFAHTGEVLGIPGQSAAGLVTFGGAVLACTGILLAARRFRAWIRRRRAPVDLPTVSVSNPAA